MGTILSISLGWRARRNRTLVSNFWTGFSPSAAKKVIEGVKEMEIVKKSLWKG